MSETVQTLSLVVLGAPACSGLVVVSDSSRLFAGPKSAAELVNVLLSAAPLHALALISLSESSLLQRRAPAQQQCIWQLGQMQSPCCAGICRDSRSGTRGHLPASTSAILCTRSPSRCLLPGAPTLSTLVLSSSSRTC